MVLPAPEGPTSANVLPAGGEGGTVEREAPVAEIGEADVANFDLDSSRTRRRANPRPVVHRLDLVVDRIEPPRRAEGVGELASDVGNL